MASPEWLPLSRRAGKRCPLYAVLASPARAEQVAFATLTAPDPPGEPLPVGIWYPTQTPASDQDIGLFTQRVAPNAAVDGRSIR